jgi:hypothetical protein
MGELYTTMGGVGNDYPFEIKIISLLLLEEDERVLDRKWYSIDVEINSTRR